MSKHSSSGKPKTGNRRAGKGEEPADPAGGFHYASPWAIPALTVLVAVALFFIALSADIYEATTPQAPNLRLLTRKLESIVAFALLGLLVCASSPTVTRPVRRSTILLALYSAGIEAGQFALGSTEGLVWNAIDVLCGAIGGFAGGSIFVRASGFRSPRDK